MERGTGVHEQRTAAAEIEDVVRIPAVERAATGRNETRLPKAAQVIGDEALRRPHRRDQLTHTLITSRQFPQESPTQRMRRKLEHRGR